jgi:TonB family protein
MYALEEEPESGERWRRLGVGALITMAVVVGLGYGAQRFEPARRLIQTVVQMTVVAELPKREAPLPPRTLPAPPPLKRAPPPHKAATKQPAAVKPATPPATASEPVVGLDEQSFGAGAGPSFQVGTTLLGDPVRVARAPAAAPPAPEQPEQWRQASLPERAERCRYSARAQSLGIEGMLLIEVAIDEQGRVTKAQVRKPLDRELDRDCLAGVQSSRFVPATLGGRTVASTRLLRLRFELER